MGKQFPPNFHLRRSQMSVTTNSDDTNGQQPEDRKVNLGRHKAQCSVCKHPNCKEIEEAWVSWVGLGAIEYEYKVSLYAIRRHCLAFNLRSKRRKNLIRAYERIVERMDGVDFNGANVLSALKEIAKLDNAEKVVDTAQSTDEKPVAQEEPAKERDDGVLGGPLTALLDKMPGLEPRQGQDGNVEPPSTQNPPLQ
jgi:hypothetical protein